MAAPGAMTQEEFYRMMLEAQLGKGNLAAQGKEADRQDLYAQQLRQGAGKGLDVAGNLSRALAGAGAGWQEREAAKARKGIATKEQDFFNEWRDRLGAKAAPMGVPPIDPTTATPPPPMPPQGGPAPDMTPGASPGTGWPMVPPMRNTPDMAPPAGPPPGMPPGGDMTPPMAPPAPQPPAPPGGPQMTPNPTVTPDASDLFQMLLKKKKEEEALMGAQLY